MKQIGGVFIFYAMMLMCLGCSKTKVEVLGSIYGVVVQAVGGEPVALARVNLDPGKKWVVTGADGRYEFGPLEPGDYRVEVWSDDYQTEMKTVSIEPGVKVNADLVLRPGAGSIGIVNNYLDFGKDDNTRVFDIVNRGKSLLAFEIRENEDWLSVSPVSDTIVPGGKCPVTVHIDRSKLTENKQYTLAVASDAGSEEVIVKVAVEDVGDLYGLITDGINNEPLQGVNVTLSPLGRAMTTGSDGRYEFTHLPIGQYNLQMAKDKYQSDTRNVTVRTGETVKLDVVMKPGKGSLQVAKNYLDFGTDSRILVFDVLNMGLMPLQFEVKGVEDWMSVEPLQTEIAPGKSQSVTVTINRQSINESKNCKLTVASDVGSEEVTVRVIKVSSGGSDGGPEGDASVISSGLIAFYTFDEGNGDDATLNAYDGNALNDPAYVSDSRNGKGISLSLVAGKKQYVNIPYNPMLDKYYYTFSFWIKDFSDGVVMGAFNTEDYLTTARGCFPRLVCRNGELVMYCNYDNYDESPAFNYNANPIKSDGKWHQITVTVSKADRYNTPFIRKLYVDGRLVANSSVAGSGFGYSQGKPSEFHIGGKMGNMEGAGMKLDNIRLYERVLGDDEIKLLYDADR